jgi:FkbM family methyltransferase
MTRLERSAIAPEVRIEGPSGRPLAAPLRGLRRLFNHGPEPLQDLARRLASRTIVHRLPEMVAHYPDGRLFHVPAHDAMYSQVYLLGEYEPTVSAVMRALLRPGDLAVDVGANHGWFALLMAARVGAEGDVLAVEPLPPMLVELERNLALNPGLGVRVEPVAVGRQDGHLNVHLFAGLPHGHASASTLGRDDYETHCADMRTLDGLVDGRPAALVKIDVEGAELEVLRGAEAVMGCAAPPILVLEVNRETSAAFGYEPHALIDALPAGAGYVVHRAEHGRLVPDGDPSSAPHGATWVCVPAAHAERTASAL